MFWMCALIIGNSMIISISARRCSLVFPPLVLLFGLTLCFFLGFLSLRREKFCHAGIKEGVRPFFCVNPVCFYL